MLNLWFGSDQSKYNAKIGCVDINQKKEQKKSQENANSLM
jgi:hypothetical protein